MKKSMKTQLFAAIAMMVVAAISLTSVGYAWFTAVANPEVRDMDMYVKATDSMFLSELVTPVLSTADHWKTTIVKTEIVTAQPQSFNYDPLGGSNYNTPKQLSDVSSVFADSYDDFYKAGFNATTGAINEFKAADPNEYVSFNLWAKSTNSGYVYISEYSIVEAIAKLLADSAGEKEFYSNALDLDTKELIKASVRVGFVPIDYTRNIGGHDVAPGTGALDWANAVIWEPNSEAHLDPTYGGEYATAGKMQTKAVSQPAPNFDPTPFVVDDHTEDQKTFDFIAGETNVAPVDPLQADKQIALFNLRADKMQQFAVYIWVEGQDGDTKNAVAKSNFITMLQFGQAKDSWITGAAAGIKTLGAVPVFP